MKRLLFCALFLAGAISPLAAETGEEIGRYILDSQLMVYSPSYEALLGNVKTLMSRFFGRNYDQMLVQVSSNSRSAYGVDIMNLNELRAAGVDIRKPVAFVHLSNQAGYMLIPVQNKKSLESFIKNNLGKRPYRFAGNYLIFSENPKLLDAVATNKNRLETDPGFSVAVSKLGFKWDKIFSWVKTSYFSEVTSSSGVTANIKIPYGFTAFTAEYLDSRASNSQSSNSRILVRNYSGILSTNQVEYIKKLREVSAVQNFELLDFISGNPAVVGNIRMNIPMLYKYYSYIDSINILGLKGMIAELRDKYGVDAERDLVENCDGRLKIAVDQYDPEKNKVLFYGSLGIKSVEAANVFLESVRTAVQKNTNTSLTAFDLFTKTFYHYQSSNFTLFYGIMDNDLVFSADLGILTNLATKKYENRTGYLDSVAPSFLKDSCRDSSVGYFLTVDIQSLFSNIKSGLMLNREFLIGVKEVDIYGNPDKDDRPYGWNTTVEVIFYN